MSATSDEEILFEEKDTKGIIILNRPKALNALTENMVIKMTEKLREWQSSKRLVIVKGELSSRQGINFLKIFICN